MSEGRRRRIEILTRMAKAAPPRPPPPLPANAEFWAERLTAEQLEEVAAAVKRVPSTAAGARALLVTGLRIRLRGHRELSDRCLERCLELCRACEPGAEHTRFYARWLLTGQAAPEHLERALAEASDPLHRAWLALELDRPALALEEAASQHSPEAALVRLLAGHRLGHPGCGEAPAALERFMAEHVRWAFHPAAPKRWWPFDYLRWGYVLFPGGGPDEVLEAIRDPPPRGE